MKKHLSLLLCLLMLVSMFSVFTVQSSAAPAAMVWDFTKPESSAELMGRDFTKVADTYLGAVRTNIAYTQPAGTGSVTYDAVNKAIVMGTPADGTDVTTMNPYFSSRVYDIAATDYSYIKIRFKLETSLPKVTLNLRGVHASGKWSNDALYTDVPQEQWVEAVFPLTNWRTAYANYPKNASNFWGSTYILQFGKGSSAYFDDDFKFTLQYIGFFKTKAEADGFTIAPTVEMKFDNVYAGYDSLVHSSQRAASYAGNPNMGSVNGLMAFDYAENSIYFKPDYSLKATATSTNVARANFASKNLLLGSDYQYVKIRYKIEADGLTGPVSLRLRDGQWHQGDDYVTKDSPVNEWVEVVHQLPASKWGNYVVIGPNTSTQLFRVQLDWPAGVNVYNDPNFRFYVQYITFFTDKAAADAYTYTAPAANDADPIIWSFDTFNAVKAYANNLNDAYIGAVGGSSTVIDFDETTKSVFLTPNAAGTADKYMHIQLYNQAEAFAGEDYPYVKIGYRLQCAESDSYLVYFRNNAWSTNWIDRAAKTGDWTEAVVDMTADSQSTVARYWYNSDVTNCDDPAAPYKWGFLLQVENSAGKNLVNDKDFRFDIQYIAFFATEEEANAFTFTPVEEPALTPVEMKLDTPNAVSTMTPDAANRAPFYASNFLMGDKNAAGGYPIGIMGYDEDERSVYFSPDYSQNGLYTNPYMSRIYISAKDATVKGEDYRYMKIRYKLESDDPNVRVFLRDSATWGSFDLFADKKTPVNEWVEVIVDMYKAGSGWTGKTVISPANVMYLQFSNNNTAVNNFDESDYRIYLQYVSFFQTKAEAEAYTYTPTNMEDLPNADDYKPTDKAIVMPFDLPKYSYNLAGNRFAYEYAIANNGFSFGADNKGNIKFDEVERAIYTEPSEALDTATQARFVIRGSKQFSGADYPYVTICYKIENYEFGKNDYLTFRCGSAWTTIKLSNAPLVADQWVTATFNLNSMPGGAAWPNVQIGGDAGTTAYDLRLQLYLNKPGTDNFTSNPDTRFYLKYIAFFQTKEDADAFQYNNWGVQEDDDSILDDPWLSVLARKYATKYAMTATCTEGGTISNIGTTQVKYKKDMTYTITAAEGYTLTDVLVDGKSVGAVTEYTFDNVKKPHTIHAVFTANAVEEGK